MRLPTIEVDRFVLLAGWKGAVLELGVSKLAIQEGAVS